MLKFTDETIITFGKYKGRKLANIPAKHLIWLYENTDIYGKLKEYIKENMDVLKQQSHYNDNDFKIRLV